jgi:hypothetical protein
MVCMRRDGNLGTGTGIRRLLDLMGTGMIFYPRVAPVPDLNRDGYGMDLTGTRYFSIDIILGCEQVKMCLFYYINYDLF